MVRRQAGHALDEQQAFAGLCMEWNRKPFLELQRRRALGTDDLLRNQGAQVMLCVAREPALLAEVVEKRLGRRLSPRGRFNAAVLIVRAQDCDRGGA